MKHFTTVADIGESHITYNFRSYICFSYAYIHKINNRYSEIMT